ncbi:MAG: DUF1456 family protein [Halobacteriovoraceae bacterium]|jgi:uncharacterized protein YehS (DUF1456 family)|nr:DUF1456 family protein [Halobacteriovoraceae bacterium]
MNNLVLRRIRYILDFCDKQMMEIFMLANLDVTREQLSQWLKKEDDPDYKICRDHELAHFLNGLISFKRGQREGDQPQSEKKLTNNIIFRKLIIAFSLKSEDVIVILQNADLRVSKHELSAFFRKPTHKNYRDCKDQILRNFLTGLQMRIRSNDA